MSEADVDEAIKVRWIIYREAASVISRARNEGEREEQVQIANRLYEDYSSHVRQHGGTIQPPLH